jgi:hypothetical protein
VVKTSDAFSFEAAMACVAGAGPWEGSVLVVVLAGGQAVVQAAEETSE